MGSIPGFFNDAGDKTLSGSQTWELVAFFFAFAVTAAFLTYTLIWLAKMFFGLIRGGTKLVPIAELEISPGKLERLEYLNLEGRAHALWLAIEVKWKGPKGWKFDVSLAVSGDVPPIQSQFPLGEIEEVEMDSPLQGSGIVGLDSRARSTPWGGKARLTKKLCDILSSACKDRVCVAIQIEPTPGIQELRLRLIAGATKPPQT